MVAAWSWIVLIFPEVLFSLHSHSYQSAEVVLGTAHVVLVRTGHFFRLLLCLLEIRAKHDLIPAISKKRRFELHLIHIEAAKRLVSAWRRRAPIIDKRGLIAESEGASALTDG